MDCSQIAQDIIASQCGITTPSGAEGVVVLLNFSDIDKTNSVITDNVISKLPLFASKKGFKYTTNGKSLNEAGASLKVGTYVNTFEHTVPLNVFVKNEDVKNFVNALASGARLVVILKNNARGDKGEVKYEVYGWDNGLSVSEVASTIDCKDGVVYKVTLKSEDSAQEGSLPKSVFDTDEKTTDALIDSLTSPAPTK